MVAFTNRLAKETSPYLLQHAHNPVDWFPWGEEALQKAKKENKPILVSIGYAACHWCHVMEKESFENETVAAIMNKYFINIKIDREERPDLDHIYMDAVQAMTGSGGWPLNVFLTPEAKPFYGGTYFPPEPAFNRASWKDVLLGVHQGYTERRHEIDAQAENLTEHILRSNSFGIQKPGVESTETVFTPGEVKDAIDALSTAADRKEGGFGKAPKFPQSFSIQFLLHNYYHTKDPAVLQQACLSLDKMICGGIYDQLGGGFARYATDNNWLVPHFEKMLYDNALLLIVMAEAYQLTGKELYRSSIHQTMEFINREWLSPEGGFYSALDADSEGVEGKYYVWSKVEIETLLKEDAPLFCEFYDVTEKGNWEHTNILNIKKPIEVFAAEKNLDPGLVQKSLDSARHVLLEKRKDRLMPLLDDKILLSWNALMITATCKIFAALGEEKYRQLAEKTMDFLWNHLQKEGVFYHTYKNGEARHPGFLEDYAYLVQALIHLQEITSNTTYLIKAHELTEFVIEHFSETETGFFFFTHANQKDVIVRKKEVYDGATPSGNAVMALNLFYLAIIFDQPSWKERAVRMTGSLQQVIVRYPTSFGVWATLLQALVYGVPEIALIGENFTKMHLEILRIFIPFTIFQSATLPDKRFPLLAGKPYTAEPKFYLCKNYACQKPVSETNELIRLLSRV
ncbi:MAG: thioredoxin domain-containing protein [Gloeobacteraceae cyanobacterium ES-bin-316]|nr:thioredoxin domain-containing protein [Ferruginibacter sp.]